MDTLDYIEIAGALLFLLLVAIFIIWIVVTSIRNRVVMNHALKDMVKMLEAIPEFDPSVSEETLVLVHGEITASSPVISPLTGDAAVYSERRAMVYVSDERNGERALESFTTTDFAESIITVNGMPITVDLSDSILLFEQEHPRYRGKKGTQINLTPGERDALKQDDILNRLGSLPSSRYPRSFRYIFEEHYVKDSETVSISGLYDPVKKQIAAYPGASLILIRNWNRESKNHLNELRNINMK